VIKHSGSWRNANASLNFSRIARSLLQQGQFEGALPIAGQILELEPGHAEASELRGKAVASLERLRQIRELLQAAQAHQTAQEPELALQKSLEGLQLDSGHVQFLSIQQWASETLERQRRINALVHDARQLASESNWELSRKKRKKGLKLEPNHQDLQQLHDRAQQELEKRKRIADLIKDCRTLLQQNQFQGVLSLSGQVLELEPGHVEASELREKATAALEHQRRVGELLEAAQTHEGSGELELALEKARAGLQLEPRKRSVSRDSVPRNYSSGAPAPRRAPC
jgi:tetratricopeptide (TPR) repeat protein